MPNALHSGRSASLPAGRSTRAPVQKSGGAGAAPRIDADGYFDGYASLFGVADLGRDVVMPGAFRASLAQRTAIGVKQLWQHDPRNPVGEWLEIAEDQRGLRVLGRLDLELPKARELHRLITRGSVDGLSIGFKAESEKHDPETGLRRLEKLDLWEISIVSFPLLPQARIAPRGDGRGPSGGGAHASASSRRRMAQF
ncbi:MAG: HK97 family phage prohead protease [Methylobacterium sp.]|nr:HK97 family phage prohead protease [Methylobacterium sp.]MCA3601622.1 HK97 family phage prohead protease [Methylobacterium sp.]MCA3603293.1 HK97 family phage prohead protease [Methylobacterium sp.]MCA3614207.1 HK97 family phage prohead protease [Methylobacterium sp.]MCA3623941.1 HK97 family phage prohead protease [Methylobacterium sp.]